jgi:hypothetical protein
MGASKINQTPLDLDGNVGRGLDGVYSPFDEW